MRTVVLLLCLVAAVSANPQFGSNGLSAEKRQDLFATNVHHIQQLNDVSRQCVTDFLRDLEGKETFIKLEQPLKDGHSVIYRFVEGKDPKVVSSVASAHKLKVEPTKQCDCEMCCGRILLPGGDVVEADAVAGTRNERGGKTANFGKSEAPTKALQPKSPEVEKEDEKEKAEESKDKAAPHSPTTQEHEDEQRKKLVGGKLRPEQKQWYYSNSVAQATKMNNKAGPLVKKLLDDLKENAPDTVLRLYSPVPNGHIIRFRIVEGDKAPLTKYISSCGLKLDGDSIVAPEDEPVHAEGDPNAPATDGHLHTAYREQNEGGIPEKVNVVDKAKRNVVQKLKDKWIKPDIKKF